MLHVWSLFETTKLTYGCINLFYIDIGDDPASISSSGTEDENSEGESNKPGIVFHLKVNKILCPCACRHWIFIKACLFYLTFQTKILARLNKPPLKDRIKWVIANLRLLVFFFLFLILSRVIASLINSVQKIIFYKRMTSSSLNSLHFYFIK